MPVISNNLYKNLLISRVQDSAKVSPKISRIPQLNTPVVTKFEKWSGKRRKLFFENEAQINYYGIRDFGLNNNLFAQLLSSPMRSERNCKTKMPKDFLLQVKLGARQDIDSHKSLELVPAVQHSKMNKNAYVVNSRELLSQQMNSSARWVPTAALMSQMRYFEIPDVAIDKSNFLTDYEDTLSSLLRDHLISASASKIELQDNDIIACFNREGNSPFEIRQYESVQHKKVKKVKVIVTNLKYIDPTWEQLINEHKNHEDGIVMRFSENEETIKLLYKILAYHYTR